jgi:hypothetical protein
MILGASMRSENMATGLVFPKMYQRLLDVVDAPAEQRPALMKKFDL